MGEGIKSVIPINLIVLLLLVNKNKTYLFGYYFIGFIITKPIIIKNNVSIHEIGKAEYRIFKI